MKRTNQKGITLIALVVTIIVLIILAGISINLLFGENGIIQKAKQAAELQETAERKEQEELANALDEMNRILDGTGYNPQGGGQEEDDDPSVIPVTGAIGAPVNTNNYGREVTNYTAANLKWRLFYEDSNNIYLISETQDGDYPLNNVQPCNYTNSTYSPKDPSYVSGESVSEQGKDLMPLLGGATTSSAGTIAIGTNSNGTNLLTSSNTNENIWATAYLCDTSADGPWATYKAGNAAWAMGGPTIELFTASYNATHTNHQISLGIGTYGYTENTASNWFVTSENHGIYRLKSSGYWWLASPYYYYSRVVHNVRDGRGNFNGGDASNAYSVRPVVCLQKSKFTPTFAAEI